jgi:hypothetical protein
MARELKPNQLAVLRILVDFLAQGDRTFLS